VATVGYCAAGGRLWWAKAAERLSVVLEGAPFAVTNVSIAEWWPIAVDGGLGDLRHDWALLQLGEQPLVGPVPFGGTAAVRRAMAIDEPVVKVGWRGDERRRDFACTILDVDADGRLLIFVCAGGVGERRSGSALLLSRGVRPTR
jgi:hypothetical protein